MTTHSVGGKPCPTCGGNGNGGRTLAVLGTLSNNKLVATLVAAIVLGVGGYVWARLGDIPSKDAVQGWNESERQGADTRTDYLQFKAATTPKIDAIQQDVKDIKESLKEIERLMRRGAQ